jgi:hypothetical protein
MTRRTGFACIVSVVLLLGFTAVPTAAAAADHHGARVDSPISFDDFTLVGDAMVINERLRLTSNEGGQVGGGWLTEQQAVAGGFRAAFTYKLTHQTEGGSDGFAFVIQNDGLAALGEGGGGIGYHGIPNSLAVEFDTFANSLWSDPILDHVSVHTRGTRENTANETASIGSTELPNLGDGLRHRVVVRYAEPRLSVHFDGVRILFVRVHLDTKLSLSDGAAWVGFTAATGGGTQEHWITRFDYTVS